MERGREREEAWSFDGASESKRSAASESEENKENLLVSSELQDDLLLYQDEDALNASIISGEPGAGRWLPSGRSQEVLPLGGGWSLCVWGWHSRHQHGGRTAGAAPGSAGGSLTSRDGQGCMQTGLGRQVGSTG